MKNPSTRSRIHYLPKGQYIKLKTDSSWNSVKKDDAVTSSSTFISSSVSEQPDKRRARKGEATPTFYIKNFKKTLFWSSSPVSNHVLSQQQWSIIISKQCMMGGVEVLKCILTGRVIQVELYLFTPQRDCGGVFFKHWWRILLFLTHKKNVLVVYFTI